MAFSFKKLWGGWSTEPTETHAMCQSAGVRSQVFLIKDVMSFLVFPDFVAGDRIVVTSIAAASQIDDTPGAAGIHAANRRMTANQQ
jgi:hypothetical protein